MNDACHRVRGLAREIQLAARRAREGDVDRAEKDLPHDLGTTAGEEFHGLRLAQAGAGEENVLHKRAGRVFLAEVEDPALRPGRVAVLGLLRRREDEHVHAAAREREGGRQARDARAEHEHGRVDARWEGFHVLPFGFGILFFGILRRRVRGLRAARGLSRGWGRLATTSSAMSIALAECVSAPADTKSTPTSAAARAVSGVMRPEASVVTSRPVASLK